MYVSTPKAKASESAFSNIFRDIFLTFRLLGFWDEGLLPGERKAKTASHKLAGRGLRNVELTYYYERMTMSFIYYDRRAYYIGH